MAAQGHLQYIAIINHHLSLCTDLPCMHSVCLGVCGHLYLERERETEGEPEEDRKAVLHWSCHEDELLDSLSLMNTACHGKLTVLNADT